MCYATFRGEISNKWGIKGFSRTLVSSAVDVTHLYTAFDPFKIKLKKQTTLKRHSAALRFI